MNQETITPLQIKRGKEPNQEGQTITKGQEQTTYRHLLQRERTPQHTFGVPELR